MIVGIGTDLIRISRVRGVAERHPQRIGKKIYTPTELAYCRSKTDPAQSLAGRFAAKESVLKVLGTGLSQGISWQHVSVLREPSGAPRVFLQGSALERARSLGIGRILVSISHGRDHAVAQAVGVSGDAKTLELPAEGV